jgi:hypothetical protein
LWQKVFENDAFCGIMHETAAEQKESRSPEVPAEIVILFILMKYLTSTAWRTPKKSTIPVLTDLGPHRPEVEKAQRAAPAECRLLTFPHGTSGKDWHIHALSQRRFSMTQAVTYERETKSVAFQGKIIVLESLTPVLPPKEKAQRKKEIERCLYEVFRKYGDRFP